MFRGMLLLLVMLMGNRSEGQQPSSRKGGLPCSDIFGDIFGETEPSGAVARSATPNEAAGTINGHKVLSWLQKHNHNVGANDADITAAAKAEPEVLPFCKFPFVYKNITYSNCTTEGDPEGLPWCSTRTDSKSKHIKGNVRQCIGPQRTRIYPGTSKCTFPFIYKDQIYFDCTTKDDPERKPWCSTMTDSQKKHQKGNIQHCSLRYNRFRTRTAASKPIYGCNGKIPAQEPVDQQIVYLEEEGNPSYWYYVTFSSSVSTSEHPKPEIVETDDNWAGWIWHECGGPDIVCLESQQYKHYYLFLSHKHYKAARYTVDPHREDWTKLKILSRVKTDRGVRMQLVQPERLTRRTLIVYVPPYCVGFQKVGSVSNDPSFKNPIDYEYKITFGITKTSSTTHQLTAGVKGTISEVFGAVAASGGSSGGAGGEASIGYTFTQQDTTAEVNKQETTLSIKVDPGESYNIWQKVAKYGNYQWNTRTQLFCPSNGQI